MATLSLISGQKPKKITVKGKSVCKGCNGTINKNDDCFAIPNRHSRGNYTPAPKRYCPKCYKKILQKTQKDLDNCSNL